MLAVENFINAVRLCLKTENWYGALGIALILPDICGKLEYPKWHSKRRYIKWYSKNVESQNHQLPPDTYKYQIPSAEDCYLLRCSVLHAGSDELIDQDTEKVLGRYNFFAPKKGWKFFGHQTGNIAQISVDSFCERICLEVEEWIKQVKGRDDIQKRCKNLLAISYLDKDGFSL